MRTCISEGAYRDSQVVEAGHEKKKKAFSDVKPRLFSLRRAQALKAANVTHVVSALRRPLDEGLFAAYKHLLVELDDVADEDILQHFAASNAFIQDGLDGGGGVLVHW